MWERFKGKTRAPWKDMGDLTGKFSWEKPRRLITGGDVAQAGRSFRERTGLGCDQFHPRWFGWISPDLQNDFANLLN